MKMQEIHHNINFAFTVFESCSNCVTTTFSLCPSALADVEVNMEDKVEVFSQGTAQITCMFTSAEGIGGTNIQWFYVSFIRPCARSHKMV